MLIKEAEAERRREAAVTLGTGTNPPGSSCEILQQNNPKHLSDSDTRRFHNLSSFMSKKIPTHRMFSIRKSETPFCLSGHSTG